MPNPIDVIFHGLFSAVDPLGMVLRTLMALLADALAQVSTDMYRGVFDATTVDFQQASVGNIWRITTGLSAALATILLVAAAFRSMLAQTNRYVLAALPGVVLALVGPQALTVILPATSFMFTSLANGIVSSATPDLAQSIRLLAGVGDNAIYEGLGLLAPIIAAALLFGLTTVFFVLMFCMVAAVVLYVLSPFAFAGLVMAPTRTWFVKWATTMFSVLFAKVPIAILLALSVSLFANSDRAELTQSFANAAAGLILGVGALLAPLLGHGLFSFMSAVAVRPSVPGANPTKAVGAAMQGTQIGKVGVSGMRTVVDRAGTLLGPARSTVTASEATPVQRSAGEAGGNSRAGASAPTKAGSQPESRSTGRPSTPEPTGPASPTGLAAPVKTVGSMGPAAVAGPTTGAATGAGAALGAGAATGGIGVFAVVAAQKAREVPGKVVGVAAKAASPASDEPSPAPGPAPQVDPRRAR